MADKPQVTWIVDRFTDLMFDWITQDKAMEHGLPAVVDALNEEYPGLGDDFKEWYGEDNE